MDAGQIVVIVSLLGACLVALLLVLIARREAAAQRAQAADDVREIRETARATAVELERREMRLADREATLAADQAQIAELQRLARAETEDALRAQRKAERALDSAERAATRTLADAERQAAARLAAAREEADAELELLAGLDREEAKARLSERLLAAVEAESAAQVRRVEARARRTAEARALRVVTTAVQRVAVPTSAASTVTPVHLRSEELKGRIIGKEGRNVRSFEALTGVNVLIDEGPETVLLSCFDPARRELAAATMEALLADGRINPQRIEQAYAEAQVAAAERTLAAGHDACERAGVTGLDDEVVALLGGLRLRTSSGQNVLEHLVETALLAAAMAAEVGADVAVTRRAAFLHDVGKGLPPDSGRSHALAGADLLRTHGEADVVVNAVAAHHDEVPAQTVEAVLVQAADAASAALPGVRRESVDQFTERMERLETLVVERPGVRRALAMAAGREVRVVVEPDEVSDAGLPELAEAIARDIEKQGEVPGEIRVTVVRELRASATAR